MNKELKKRIITSIILIAIILNCLFINNYSWLLLLSIVSFICWFEFINLVRKIWKTKKTFISGLDRCRSWHPERLFGRPDMFLTRTPRA